MSTRKVYVLYNTEKQAYYSNGLSTLAGTQLVCFDSQTQAEAFRSIIFGEKVYIIKIA